MGIHNGQIEIVSWMADSFLMEAYASHLDEKGKVYHINSIADIPRVPRSLRREAELTAAMLYQQMATGWKIDPFIVFANNDMSKGEIEEWAHYTVMEALGQGVGWLDSHDPIMWASVLEEKRELPTPGSRGLHILIEGIEWRSR